MSRLVEDMLQSILDDFKIGKQTQEAEEKTLFRLLNYCPPPVLTKGETDPPPKGNAITE